MKGGPQVALAVAAGYFLGRHRRFKLAIGLAVAGATGRLGGAHGNLLEQGLKLLTSSPEVEKIVDSVRGDLFEAGKAAAKAATSRQVSSLSTKLQERADALQHAANVAAGLEETTAGAAEDTTKAARGGVSSLKDRAAGGMRAAKSRMRRHTAEETEEREPYQDEYDEYDRDDYEGEPRRREPSAFEDRERSGGRSRQRLDDDQEPEDDREPPSRVARDEAPPRSRPVHRTRR